MKLKAWQNNLVLRIPMLFLRKFHRFIGLIYQITGANILWGPKSPDCNVSITLWDFVDENACHEVFFGVISRLLLYNIFIKTPLRNKGHFGRLAHDL